MRLVTSWLLTCLIFSGASAAELQSVSRIAFGPADTLFVADWKAAKIQAIELPPAQRSTVKPFNILDLSVALSQKVGAHDVTIEDMAVRPGTGDAYVAVSYGKARIPAIFSVRSDGAVNRLDLKTAKSTSAGLANAPSGDYKFWGRIPQRSYTVTDMQWHDGKLYVAGLSNQAFASTLRVLSYPFDGAATMTSVEMYHTSHNQMETRAPIRAMTFASFGGTEYLIAAYLCTPLVSIPVAELKDGAHVTGKTIAELGYGNLPSDMLTFTAPDQNGKPSDYLLIANVERDGYLIPMEDVAKAIAAPGLSQPVAFGSKAGPQSVDLPLARVLYISNLGPQYILALRRDVASGAAQLVSYNKDYKFRISDFVSEYDFPDYSFNTDFQKKYIKPVVDKLETEEGFKPQ